MSFDDFLNSFIITHLYEASVKKAASTPSVILRLADSSADFVVRVPAPLKSFGYPPGTRTTKSALLAVVKQISSQVRLHEHKSPPASSNYAAYRRAF